MANDAAVVALALTAVGFGTGAGLPYIVVGRCGMGAVIDRQRAPTRAARSPRKLASDGPQCCCGQRGCISLSADYAPTAARFRLRRRRRKTFRRRYAARRARRSPARTGIPGRRPPRWAEAVAATIPVLRPHHVVLAGLQASDDAMPEGGGRRLPYCSSRPIIRPANRRRSSIYARRTRGSWTETAMEATD